MHVRVGRVVTKASTAGVVTSRCQPDLTLLPHETHAPHTGREGQEEKRPVHYVSILLRAERNSHPPHHAPVPDMLSRGTRAIWAPTSLVTLELVRTRRTACVVSQSAQALGDQLRQDTITRLIWMNTIPIICSCPHLTLADLEKILES